MTLSLALLIAVVSPGQPIFTTLASIEALTVPADCVFTGKVEKIESSITVPKNGRRGLHLIPGGLTLHTLTIKVDKILKGKPGKSVVLQVETSGYDERWPQWTESNTPFIWFTGPGEYDKWTELGSKTIPAGPVETDIRWIWVRISELTPGERPNRAGLSLPMFAMDMSILRTSEEVISRARAYIKSAPKSPTLHKIDLPSALIKEAGFSYGGPYSLVVPKETLIYPSAPWG